MEFRVHAVVHGDVRGNILGHEGGKGTLTVVTVDGMLGYSGFAYTTVAGSGECTSGNNYYSHSFTGVEDWFLTGPDAQISDDPTRLTGEYSYSGGTGDNQYTQHYTWISAWCRRSHRLPPPHRLPRPASRVPAEPTCCILTPTDAIVQLLRQLL